MGRILGIALIVAIAPRATETESGAGARPVVLFAQGSAGSGAGRTLLVPVVCYKPGVGLVSAATSDCLSLLPRDAQVTLDSGPIVRVSKRETARCTDEDGKPTGESRASLAVSGQPARFSYAVWPPSARSLIKPVSQSARGQPGDVPLGELDSVATLVSQYARRQIVVLQRLKADLDGDGQADVAYSVDVRCTKEEMQARGGDSDDDEPPSCFNGLVVRWGGTTTFSVVTQDWDLGQIGAISDLDGDRHPEILVFAQPDEGFRTQVFSVDKRRLTPLEPWCCGCAKKKPHMAGQPGAEP